jgi:hypothetical protein
VLSALAARSAWMRLIATWVVMSPMPLTKAVAALAKAELAPQLVASKFARADCWLSRHACADCHADGLRTQLKRRMLGMLDMIARTHAHVSAPRLTKPEG